MPKKQDSKDQRYLDERKIYIDLLKESGSQLDKNLLYIATGSLILSLTFIEKIVNNPIKDTLFYLLLSWIFLLTSIFITLISFYTSYKSCLKEIAILDSKYLDQSYDEKNLWTFATNKLNILSIIVLIFGIGFQVFFSYKNLNAKFENTTAGKSIMTNKNETTSTDKSQSKKLDEDIVIPKTTPKNPKKENETTKKK
jgi:hypothetical protein